MRKVYFATAAAALGAVLTGGALGLTGAAAAAPTSDPAQCGAGDLNISTSELQNPGNDGNRLFQIEFAAKPGVSCQLAGTPQNLIFSRGDQPLPMPIDEASPGEADPVVVDESHPAVSYLSGPSTEGPARAGGLAFDLPSGGHDTHVTTRWTPLEIDGPVTISPVTAPVS